VQAEAKTETGTWINERCKSTLQLRMTLIGKPEFHKKVHQSEKSPKTDRMVGRSLTVVAIRQAVASLCLPVEGTGFSSIAATKISRRARSVAQ
jgi:hypothetical protein